MRAWQALAVLSKYAPANDIQSTFRTIWSCLQVLIWLRNPLHSSQRLCLARLLLWLRSERMFVCRPDMHHNGCLTPSMMMGVGWSALRLRHGPNLRAGGQHFFGAPVPGGHPGRTAAEASRAGGGVPAACPGNL